MKIVKLEEILSFMLIDTCIDQLDKENIKSSSNNEKINKLQKIKKDFIEEKTKYFLELTPEEEFELKKDSIKKDFLAK